MKYELNCIHGMFSIYEIATEHFICACPDKERADIVLYALNAVVAIPDKGKVK